MHACVINECVCYEWIGVFMSGGGGAAPVLEHFEDSRVFILGGGACVCFRVCVC
jgi:hypothetical protein